MKLSKKELEKLTERAIIDCCDDSERLAGFYTMLEENLSFPFPAKIVGEEVKIIGINQEESRIQAICVRNAIKYPIDILYIKCNPKKIKGWKWIEAYREWAKYI